MSKARDKGTRVESELLDLLKGTWPNIARRGTTMGALDDGDYTNTSGVLVEAKKVDQPTLYKWIRVCRKKALHGRWLIFWCGDRRTEDGQPVVVLPLTFAIDLLHAYYGPFGAVAYAQRNPPDINLAAPTAPHPAANATTGNEAA